MRQSLLELLLISCVFLTFHSSLAADVSLTVNTQNALRQVSPDLFGVFFEELNHAGQGGLYSQLIQNSNFETNAGNANPWTGSPQQGVSYRLSLSTAKPLTAESPHALQVTTTSSTSSMNVGICNPGYWGISLVNQTGFTVSFWAYSNTITSLIVALTNADQSVTYAQAAVNGINSGWNMFNTSLMVGEINDPKAVFTLTWYTTGQTDTIFFDVVTLFPSPGWRGLPFIRSDLSEMIAAIHPSIVRLPGGSYVDGVNIAGRFEWNNTLYGLEHRRGHPNLWGYWGEDGLGIYEYFSWVEQLRDIYGNPTRIVWVINAGISYGGEVITPAELGEWIQDAINSVEFAIGSVTTPYGAIRAVMGHPAPFRLDYMAIGNENCQGAGAPTYNTYYPQFYKGIKAAYPSLPLIANCNGSALGKFDLYDWHTYPAPNQMYGMGHVFDDYDPNQQLFVSEYAAKGGSAGNGTLDAALSEAVFMNGLEVNSHIIHMASYAPLFANANGYEWQPDAIYFTSDQVYGTPSYWDQILYANSFQGLVSPPMTLRFSISGVATAFSASVTVGTLTSDYSKSKNGANTAFIFKLVNHANSASTATIDLQGLPSSATFPAMSDLGVLQSPSSNPADLNTFGHPRRVSPAYSTVNIKSASFTLDLPAYSLSVLRVYVLLSSVVVDTK